MTTPEKQPRAGLVHWTGWPEMFPWNSRLAQLFDSKWPGHADELAPGGALEETDDTFRS